MTEKKAIFKLLVETLSNEKWDKIDKRPGFSTSSGIESGVLPIMGNTALFRIYNNDVLFYRVILFLGSSSKVFSVFKFGALGRKIKPIMDEFSASPVVEEINSYLKDKEHTRVKTITSSSLSLTIDATESIKKAQEAVSHLKKDN